MAFKKNGNFSPKIGEIAENHNIDPNLPNI
jgi:hypothetical protein